MCLFGSLKNTPKNGRYLKDTINTKDTMDTEKTEKTEEIKIRIKKTVWRELLMLKERPSDTHNSVVAKLIKSFKKGSSERL